ncbi:hypothetical protein HHI36_000741 [Cryptolaemus montrouzieri]|uniref:Uncharacterized protein n=1 Tax=Cryptolaemus montrouzieri TaxID=559131 RepID=A0ABD2P5T7_9CUCU
MTEMKSEIQKASKLAKQNTGSESVYFDGRKDYTAFEVKKGSKFSGQLMKDHISFIGEPDSNSRGHVTPISRQSDDFANYIFHFLLKNYPHFKEDINVICFDGVLGGRVEKFDVLGKNFIGLFSG